jgi:hypothetical protein
MRPVARDERRLTLRAYFPNASSTWGTSATGSTVYHVAAMAPCSSIRKADRGPNYDWVPDQDQESAGARIRRSGPPAAHPERHGT